MATKTHVIALGNDASARFFLVSICRDGSIVTSTEKRRARRFDPLRLAHALRSISPVTTAAGITAQGVEA